MAFLSWHRRRFAEACLLVVGAALLGCADERLEPCDIRTRACQVDVFYALQRIRGDGWDPFGSMPPVRVIKAADYQAELEARQPPADPDAPPHPWDLARQLFGIVTRRQSATQSAIEDRVVSTGAFYSSGTREVTVIDHGGRSLDDPDAVVYATQLLAHEIVHALQDREVAFARFNDDKNAWYSWRAAIEGEAQLYEWLLRFEMEGWSEDDVDLEAFFARELARGQTNVARSASPFYAADRLVYPLSLQGFFDVYMASGNVGVRQLYRDRPEGAIEWMRRLAPTSGSDPGELQCMVIVPSGFQRFGADRLGAIQIFGLLVADREDRMPGDDGPAPAPTDPPIDEAWRLALAWVDDRMWVLRHADRGVAAEWHVRFRTEKNAADAAALLKTRSMRAIEVDGHDLRLRVAEDEALLDVWPGSACPLTDS